MRNIKEHKFRTFLIILSIALSVMLFFASFSISDALSAMFMENIKTFIGTSEVAVYAGPMSESGLVTLKDLGEDADRFEYQIGSVDYSVKYQKKDKSKADIHLRGFSLEDLAKINPITLVDPGDVENNFSGKTAIISADFAEENHLQVGDSMKFIFSEDDTKVFRVGAIGENRGYFKKSFMSDGETVNMIIPIKTAQNFMETKSAYQLIYLKTADEKNIEQDLEFLQTLYKGDYVEKTITKGEIDAQIRPIRVPFLFMLTLVVLISVFIIYTSFKVIMLERLPILGTFRSIGATKRMTNTIMIVECFLYGMIGSVAGTILGTFALSMVMKVMVSSFGGDVTLDYPQVNLLYAFLFGITLSTISAIIPIAKTTKIPVKEILLNIVEGTKRKRPYLRFIIAFLFIIAAYALPKVLSTGMMAAASGGLSIVCAIVAAICFIPYLSDMLLTVSERLFGALFGNIGRIALKNLKGNKSTYDNVILLVIGLTSIVTISVLGDAMERETLAYFDAMHYDVSVTLYGGTQTSVQRVLTVKGIDDIINYEESWGGYKINGEERSFVSSAYGANDAQFFDYFQVDVLDTEDDEAIYEKLLNGRNMILSTKVQEKYGLTLDQEVHLETEAGNKDYRIIGFFNESKSAGMSMITSGKNVRHDTKNYDKISLAIRVQPGVDPDMVVSGIEQKASQLPYYRVDTLKQLRADYLQENQMIVTVLGIFSAATAFIGSIGVMNNFMVSFLSRRKSFAILTSVGMSRKQRKKLIWIEAAAAGFIGSIFGLVTGFIIIKMVGVLLEKIGASISLMLTPMIVVGAIVGAVSVCLLASVSVARQSSGISVLEELKYE
ncbi:MAG: ABC transporter permease [Clostridia bacterium]|nr:ABC transporter permease [Clostridia bacterium]